MRNSGRANSRENKLSEQGAQIYRRTTVLRVVCGASHGLWNHPRIYLFCIFAQYLPGPLTVSLPTCRSDGGSSESRCVRVAAAAGCGGAPPVCRGACPALPDPVLLHWHYGGLSRPGTSQRTQEHTPQRGEAVSIKEERADERNSPPTASINGQSICA